MVRNKVHCEQKEVNMKQEKQTIDSSMSLSKQRKLQRQKEIAHQKRQKKINKILGIVVVVAIIAGVGSYVGYKIYRNATKIVASDDYSKYIADNGFIDGVTATEAIDLCDYTGITVPLSDVEYTDESVESDIQSQLEQHKTLDKKTTTAIADGDKVNIDFVGTVDGVEFEGGNSKGEGSDLTIGSGTFIDDFEQQLIGHKAGDAVTVNVTFPDDYSNDPTLAGKDAVFQVTINGLYVKPEFTDAFVKEYLSDYASTVEEYKTYLKDTNYNTNLDKWLSDYLVKETTVKSYPKKYLSQLAATMKNSDYNYYESMKSYFAAMSPDYANKSFTEYIGMSEVDYDKQLRSAAKETAKANLIYQAILEKEGVTVTVDDYKEYMLGKGATEEDYNNQIKQYGTGYSVQQMVKVKALEILKGMVTVQ
ncbi:FKBP-type peptidyl-prolyl cis-trans isomerase [Anaerosporobacter faecicola]|uniref:FKBP-type peptidyl-prolyl cis-trans isomerase n=1 Tax=Anaerosporobacter faecicola TaxID=2718714 RepID=UPI00143B4118|nr:FKBP-type peptidyl-prolyl cis-trans isomerase [Anaerosporobacter faecicola]